MRPEELLPQVLRRWWIFVIAVLATTLTGYIVVTNQPDEYTVSIRVVANAEPADYWLDLYAKNRLATFVPLISNYEFIASALGDASLDIDPSLAQRKLQVGQVSSANTLTLTVVDTDPQRAADIANAVQSAVLTRNEEYNADLIARVQLDPEVYPSRVNLIAVETAGPPDTASGPAVRSTTLAAAILGLVLGSVIVFFLIYRDQSLKTPTEIDRYLERPVIALVPPGAEFRRGS